MRDENVFHEVAIVGNVLPKFFVVALLAGEFDDRVVLGVRKEVSVCDILVLGEGLPSMAGIAAVVVIPSNGQSIGVAGQTDALCSPEALGLHCCFVGTRSGEEQQGRCASQTRNGNSMCRVHVAFPSSEDLFPAQFWSGRIASGWLF
jgi:hypothetical protein